MAHVPRMTQNSKWGGAELSPLSRSPYSRSLRDEEFVHEGLADGQKLVNVLGGIGGGGEGHAWDVGCESWGWGRGRGRREEGGTEEGAGEEEDVDGVRGLARPLPLVDDVGAVGGPYDEARAEWDEKGEEGKGG